MWQALGAAIDALSADDALRCVIVRGAGEKAFSPGNDIAEFATERGNKAQAIDYGRVMHATAHALATCRHPLVAQIHGICVGGGLEIAALCDLRICGESSRFGAPIKNLGLVMAYPEMAPLVRLAGPDVALEILLEGRIFGAAEAKEKRLVTRVVPDADVATEALATAQRIAEGAPLVARWHKKFARRLGGSAADHRGRSTTNASPASTPRIFASATRRFWPSASPSSSGAEHARTPRHRPDAKRAMTAAASGQARSRHIHGPLAGMRVLELAQIMAGPTCGMMLADMGADVIKVEKLPGGDDARGYREPRINGVSAPFLMMNRNKRGIALNLKARAGPRDSAAARPRCRRADRELSSRHAREARAGLRRAVEGESRAHLLRGVGLRTRRTACRQRRLRSDRAGLRRPDVGDRRARTPSGQERQSGRRHQCGPPRRGRGRRRVCPQAEDRAAARSSTRRCWRPRCSRPTGTRRSTSRPANRPARADRRISSPRPTRRFAPATAGSTSAARTRRTGSGSPTCSDIPSGATIRVSRPIRRAWRISPR